ncbi:hypothetical protein STIAU_0620 [Stigmatella aurantiaca DW4/3-1]|uniref:Uncharacterized protein n=1 Tax=Stigmatella aurantiaca (strain DW4/3-1) TaxID=378806 RepID=Q096I8_STIAD|nr:hypothetical protein STIAU_0620 [Stigmatella aurantiaca DW4/3-1]
MKRIENNLDLRSLFLGTGLVTKFRQKALCLDEAFI